MQTNSRGCEVWILMSGAALLGKAFRLTHLSQVFTLLYMSIAILGQENLLRTTCSLNAHMPHLIDHPLPFLNQGLGLLLYYNKL